MENISSLRQLEIFTLSMTQAHSMGKGGDYLKKFMPAHRPYRNIHFCHDWYPTIFSMLTPETIFHYSTSNIKLVLDRVRDIGHIISEEEIKTIEHDINGKLDEMDKLRDFFGSGHGVNIVNLISSWITREIVPHEKRLGVNGLLPKLILRRNAVLLTTPLRVFTHLRLKILSIRKLVP